jgi:hypothetical protein
MLIALDEGELDLAVGFLPRVRRWHERQALYETEHDCLFNPDLLRLPVPVPIEAFAACGYIVPSSRAEMASFVDEALEERGLRSGGGDHRAVHGDPDDAEAGAGDCDLACADRALLRQCRGIGDEPPAPSVAELDRLHGLASARRRIAVDRLAARPLPRGGRLSAKLINTGYGGNPPVFQWCSIFPTR